MTLNEYHRALKRHDWYYEYTEDHSVWQRGLASYNALRAARKEIDPAGDIWNQYAPSDFQIKEEA